MTNQDKKYIRLDYVELYMNSTFPEEEIIKFLYENNIVSNSYTTICLRADQWYLNKVISPYKKSKLLSEASIDSAGTILLHVIVSALTDFRSGKPCDNTCWSNDISAYPPCTCEVHNCAPIALQFLQGLGDIDETLNLSPRTISLYIQKLKTFHKRRGLHRWLPEIYNLPV